MLIEARANHPPSLVPDAHWGQDEMGGAAPYWLVDVQEQSLAISPEAERLQDALAWLGVYVAQQERELEAPASPARSGPRERFLDHLHACFEEEPLEDGMDHPAEQVIATALDTHARGPVLDWIRRACLDPARPAFSAAVLICVARQAEAGDRTWRRDLVRDALMAHDAEVRDAAVQAAETWGDSGLRQVLEAHRDPVPWLDEYVRGVVEDLDG